MATLFKGREKEKTLEEGGGKRELEEVREEEMRGRIKSIPVN